MECVMCGKTMSLIKGGVSKKSGKPYDAFYSCECGQTFNPPKGTEVRTSMVHNPIEKPKNDTYVEGKKENTTLMCRKDLMVAIVNKWQDVVDTEKINETFGLLWKEIEK